MLIHKFRYLVLFSCIGIISYQSFGADASSEKPLALSSQTHIANNRSIQDIALKAFEQALQEDSKSILHISPNGTGKTLVLAQALKSRIQKWEVENNKTTTEAAKTTGKISIVTAHQIHLVDQLALSIYQEVRDTSVNIVNWNNVRQRSRHKSFSSYLSEALDNPHPTVFVITTQSLKPALDHLFQEYGSRNSQGSLSSSASPISPISQSVSSLGSSLYERLAKNLDGIYIDEAHHLGAPQTKRFLLTLWESSRAFLYGATTTPFHYDENISDLFEREHWSYLNKADNLFEKHSIEDILDQLSLAIKNRDVIPFNDLYVIGESSFKEIKDQPVFIQGRSDYFVLNPVHYERLAQILYPVLSANKKGFIVTATIAEAERLQEFLSKTFREIQFEVYHSHMSRDERRGVFRNSEKATGSHYIVAVRALDEGVNLPHLSAYIDLNFTVSVRQMIQRIGRVLRLYQGKKVADVLFLVDYKNAGMVRDILNILEKVEKVSFRENGGGNKDNRSGDSHFRFLDSEITPLTREDLLGLRKELQSSIRKFWSGKELRWLTWEELRAEIMEYNKRAPEGERINSTTYVIGKLYKKIPGAPSNPDKTYSDFKERGGWPALLGKISLTLEELRAAIIEYNSRAPEGERINSTTYVIGKLYKKIPGAPSNPNKTYSDFKERGGWQALLGKPVKPPTLTWEELRAAIIEYNKQAPEGEKITSQTYTTGKLYKKIPGAPSNPDQTYSDFKERGGWQALLGKISLTFEELRAEIMEYNKRAPEGERINSKTYVRGKLYKKIPGAPSSPDQTYSDFKERGGWQALLGKISLTFEELRAEIMEYNKRAPEGERINSTTYVIGKLYKKIPGAPSNPNKTYSDFKERGGWFALLGKISLTLEELRAAIIEYNNRAPEGERINSTTYIIGKLYKKIPGAPSNPNRTYSDFKERGGWPALLGKISLTLEELRAAIIEYNNRAPEGERINSTTYIIGKLYKKIPGAPSNPNRTYSDFKERGGWPALLGKICPRAFTAK